MDVTRLIQYTIAQILLTIITFIGIVISLWLSVKALREVQTDRKLRQRPHLAFELGGNILPVEFEKAGRYIPGIDPEYVEKAFPNLPDDAESVRLKGIKNKVGYIEILSYGKLKNYGTGPALSTEVTWVPQEIWFGSKKFVLDNKKLLEPLYRKELNRMPLSPNHILPGEKSDLSRLPTFIEKDFEKKVTRVNGVLEIECEDVFEEKHIINQEFNLSTNYKSEKPWIIVTFGDLIESEYDY